ncbi:MAG: glycosyl transferase family 2, partial [Bacteroidaceae bacterium]|nr:glycosyl transferase family 2 [Bacteroidaceae bacterium]
MGKQVFQTESTSRWKKFQWSIRLLFFIAAILIAALVIMLIIDKSPNLPFKQDYKSVITASRPFMQETRLSKEYKGFRKYIADKKLHTNYEKEKRDRIDRQKKNSAGMLNADTDKTIDSWNRFPAGIRSAFYVAWDPQSFFSLKRNIKNLNLIMPEWFFIDPKTDQ